MTPPLFGLSTQLAWPERVDEAWLERAQSAGFQAVELIAARPSFDYRERGQLAELAAWFRDSPLRPLALRMPPDADIANTDRQKRLEHLDELKRVLETLERIACPFVIQPFGAPGDPYHGRRVDAAYESLAVLNPFARDRGAAILLENGPGEFAAPASLVRFLAVTRLDNGVSFDCAHAHVRGGVEDGFLSLESLVRSVQVHLPLADEIDWPRLPRLLRRRPEPLPLIAQVSAEAMRDEPHPHQAAHDALARLIELRDPGEEE